MTTTHVGRGSPYYSEQRNRHGKMVIYYRRPGFPKIQLKAAPGTAAMDREFAAAAKTTDALAAAKAAGTTPARPMVVCKPSTNPDYIRRFGDTAEPGALGTLRWAVDQYEASSTFKALGKHTRDCYRINLRRVVSMRCALSEVACGEWALADMELEHVERIQRELRHKPPTADATVKVLRVVINWATRAKLFKGSNPTAGVTWLHRYDDGNEGWPTWERDALADYERTHRIGTPARTALALILYAGARITDVSELSRFHEKARGTELHWIESKGRNSTAEGRHRPVNKHRRLIIPPELRAILDATPAGARAFVTQPNGKAYTRGSIQSRFKRWCREAGLDPRFAAHGARKLSASMMIEAGASEADLCSVFGWKLGSRMAAWYGKRFNQQVAQRSGFAALRRAMTEAA